MSIKNLKGHVFNPELIKGDKGDSAYDIAVKDGFEGTEEEWLNFIKGKDAYKCATEAGFIGTEEEFYLKLTASIAGVTNSIYITPQMYGAKGDGKTDDTTAIQAALNASSYVYIPDGTYVINGTNGGWGHTNEGGILPRSNQTILLSNGATLKVKANDNGFYNIVNIVDVENVHIIGGKVQGIKTTPTSANYGSEFGIGVNISGASNITIENMEVFDCWGDSICIGYTGNTQSHNIKVTNCVLHGSRRQGVSIIGAINAVIRDCEIYNIGGTKPEYGIDIEPDGTGIATDITIDNCYIHDNIGGSIVTASGNEDVNRINNVNITNCTLDIANLIAGSNINLSNCFIKDARFCTIKVVRCSNSTINFIYLAGGNCTFDNCDMVLTSNDFAIIVSEEGYPTKKSKMTCYNCRLSTNDTCKFFMLAKTSDLCADLIKFVDCTIELGTNCLFNNNYICTRELRLENSKVVFNRNLYELIGTGGNGEANLILSNTEIECEGEPRYMFTTEGSNVFHIEISNCKLPNVTAFMYCGEGASGSVRLFNNNLSKTNFDGAGADGYEKTIINSFVTEIPSNYVTDEELAQKGYLTLSTLPKYNGGVS